MHLLLAHPRMMMRACVLVLVYHYLRSKYGVRSHATVPIASIRRSPLRILIGSHWQFAGSTLLRWAQCSSLSDVVQRVGLFVHCVPACLCGHLCLAASCVVRVLSGGHRALAMTSPLPCVCLRTWTSALPTRAVARIELRAALESSILAVALAEVWLRGLQSSQLV